MRSVAHWLGEYGESHGDPTNKLLHRVCVPLIVLSLAGMVWSIPVPRAFVAVSPWINWATLGAALALVYYASLSVRLAIGVSIAFATMFAILSSLADLPWPLWITSLAIFVAAWIGQFTGHAIEGTRPSFFKDLQFLLIGPLWLLAALYRRLGISY
ncbi:MAG: Mpo1-like protein [Gammaproteobacteria bacterium]